MAERQLRIGQGLTFPVDAVTQTFVIFGKRESGKSNTAVVMAEEMHRVGAPIVVLDPISAWWGLKSSFDGTGKGLPVYVFGGPHQDLPLEPTAGELMAQLFIDHRIPMILDMKGWTGGERARFVTAFAVYLLGHNDRVPAHVFLEEADAFIPQRPYKGEEAMLGAMDRLIRWGRQEGLGATAVSQRSAKINKDVTTQAETLIAHRTTGPQDREAIDNWIRYHAGDELRQELLSSLPKLPAGKAWIWSPAWLDIFEQVQIRRRETFDSAATPKLGEKRIEPKALAEVDLDRLRDRMAATIEKAEAEDPRKLQVRIRQLERQLQQRPAEQVTETVVEERVVEIPVLNGQVDKLTVAVTSLRDIGEQLVSASVSIVEAADGITAAIDRVTTAKGAPGRAPQPPRAMASTPRSIPPPRPAAPVRPVSAPPPDEGEARPLRAGARRMLQALAQLHPTRLTPSQMGTLADMSTRSGTWSDYMSAIRTGGYIVEYADGRIGLSDLGEQLMYNDLGSGAPSVDELAAMWSRKLRAGARRMLGAVVAAYPNGLTRDELAKAVQMSNASGTWSDYMSKLRTLGLIDESQGDIRAGEALFLGMDQ